MRRKSTFIFQLISTYMSYFFLFCDLMRHNLVKKDLFQPVVWESNSSWWERMMVEVASGYCSRSLKLVVHVLIDQESGIQYWEDQEIRHKLNKFLQQGFTSQVWQPLKRTLTGDQDMSFSGFTSQSNSLKLRSKNKKAQRFHLCLSVSVYVCMCVCMYVCIYLLTCCE